MINKNMKSTVVAAALLLASISAPLAAAPPAGDVSAESSASPWHGQTWVAYWLNFLSTLDRRAWAQG
ncbi:MAG TPA: hypothetical protein VM240_08125 [Verrucomicrobiae bacterium]|nr:hypothetical protein [Verrucomicrobiae bacterium]